MTSPEFKSLLDKYSRGECTPEEEHLIFNWYNNIDNGTGNGLKEEYRIIVQAKLWSKLKPTSRKFSFTSLRKIAAVFVTLILTAGAVYFTNQFFQKEPSNGHAFINNKGEQAMKVTKNKSRQPYHLTLTDGSEIVLQPSSEIRYPEKFKDDRREVYLYGEAFFKVKRDTLHPFIVYSGDVVTKVLGTSFTIKAYQNDDITVAVQSGKVAVYKVENNQLHTLKNEEVILIHNQQAVYNNNAEIVKQLVPAPIIVLPEPTLFEMEYDGAPVVKIFNVLEENYGIDIVFDESMLQNCNLTTSMSDEGLYERIKIICEAIGAGYEIEETSIIIHSTGCH